MKTIRKKKEKKREDIVIKKVNGRVRSQWGEVMKTDIKKGERNVVESRFCGKCS
jgi:hypothetical protein